MKDVVFPRYEEFGNDQDLLLTKHSIFENLWLSYHSGDKHVRFHFIDNDYINILNIIIKLSIGNISNLHILSSCSKMYQLMTVIHLCSAENQLDREFVYTFYNHLQMTREEL